MKTEYPEAVAAVQARLAEILPSFAELLYLAPIIIMVAGAFVALMTGVFRGRHHEPHLPSYGVAVISAATAAIVPFMFWPSSPMALFGSGVLLDDIAKLAYVVIPVGTLFTVLMASLTNTGRLLLRSEMVALLLFSSTGMMAMVSAGEFLSFFIALEIMSLSLYVMVGYQKESAKSLEAAVKYFILGACASGFILMGSALIYLHVGSFQFAHWAMLGLSVESAPLAVVGAILFLSGLGFKLAIAPFHSWAPDVYQGSHSTLTGYMATLVKFSVSLVILRILGSGFGQGSSILVTYFWLVGALSIGIGSLFGLVHNSVKRILAYSSIANAGYFCLSFATLAVSPDSVFARESLVAYSVIYVILTLGAFAVLAWLEEGNRDDLLKEDLAGLAKRSPFAAVSFTIFLFGLAGIPPLAGFFGKFMLIGSAVSADLIGLSALLVLFSCLSLYYYLSILVEIWFKPDNRHTVDVADGPEFKQIPRLVGLLALISIVIGVFGPRWAQSMNWEVAYEKPSSVVGTVVREGEAKQTAKKVEDQATEVVMEDSEATR